MERLYIFNPDHDLALASDSDHYDAPRSAKLFARDCAMLPLWYGEGSYAVCSERIDLEWFEKICEVFPQQKKKTIVSSIENAGHVLPWGWNKTVRRKLEQDQCGNLPSMEFLSFLRQIQHRRFAIEATQYMSVLESSTLRLAKPAVLLSENEVSDFVKQYPFAIFKAPWSGSGKGIIRSLGSLPEGLYNRAKNIANKQNGIIAERLYSVVQDFAMEFQCKDGFTQFVGYSLFKSNEHGAYQGNVLASDEQIVGTLSHWISVDDILAIQKRMIQFLNEMVASQYSGYLGVDMFIFQEGDDFFVHPCVEINFRMTMGLVARKFYDSYVEQGRTGSFSIQFSSDCANLLKTEKTDKLDIIGGKIRRGVMSLTPIYNDTQYYARVSVD